MWDKLCMFIKDLGGIQGTSYLYKTVNTLAETSLKMGIFLILKTCLFFYFIKEDENSVL